VRKQPTKPIKGVSFVSFIVSHCRGALQDAFPRNPAGPARFRGPQIYGLDPDTVLVQHNAMNEDRPVYLRLRDRIAAMILEGKVRDGDPLPSVRSLAADFGANPLTVAKAYQTFQEEGLVVVKRGIGMFVAAGAGERLRNNERKDFLENRWPGIVSHMRRLGLDVEELIERALV